MDLQNSDTLRSALIEAAHITEENGQSGAQSIGGTGSIRAGMNEALSPSASESPAPRSSSNVPRTPTQFSDLPQPPANVAEMRRRLFELNESVHLTPDEYRLYWPYVSNIWAINSFGKFVAAKGTKTSHYRCRLWRKETAKPQGTGQRQRPIRQAVACGMKLRDIEDTYGGHTLERHGDCQEHNHSLDRLDSIKKPAAIRALAGAIIAKGLTPAQVTQKLQSLSTEMGLDEAGSKHFSRQDANNAGKSWKAGRLGGTGLRVSHQNPVLTGSCQCGAVTFTSTSLPKEVEICHCQICRKLSGSPFITFGEFATASLAWTFPSLEVLKPTSYSDIAERGHCARCGSPMYMRYKFQPEQIAIPMSAIDENSVLGVLKKPEMHLFVKEKASWCDLPDDGLPRYDGFPGTFSEKINTWRQNPGT